MRPARAATGSRCGGPPRRRRAGAASRSGIGRGAAHFQVDDRSGAICTPRTSCRYRAHSGELMPCIAGAAWSTHRPPVSLVTSRRAASHRGSESRSTPSRSNTTASVTPRLSRAGRIPFTAHRDRRGLLRRPGDKVPDVEATRIVLIRHGESDAQERQIVGGHEGCLGLSQRGRTEAVALRDRLVATGELRERLRVLRQPDGPGHGDGGDHRPRGGPGATSCMTATFASTTRGRPMGCRGPRPTGCTHRRTALNRTPAGFQGQRPGRR